MTQTFDLIHATPDHESIAMLAYEHMFGFGFTVSDTAAMIASDDRYELNVPAEAVTPSVVFALMVQVDALRRALIHAREGSA